MIRWFAALCAVVSSFAFETHAAAVWVAEGDTLHSIDASTNRIVRSFARHDTRLLAGAHDGTLWVLGKKRLTRMKPDGALLVDVELKALSLRGSDYLVADARETAIWLAEGKEDDENENDGGDGRAKRIVRVDAAGNRAANFVSPGRVRALASGLDGSLWLLGNKKLWHYTPAGTQLAQIDLDAIAHKKSTLLAVDSFGVWLWLTGDEQLLRLDGDSASAVPLKITLTGKAEALVADPRTGTLWVVSAQTLAAYGPDGTIKKSLDLKAIGVQSPRALVVDSANAALWLGHDQGVTRFALDGSRVAAIALDGVAEAIGVPPLTLTPSVSVLTPAEGALLNQPAPLLRLAYGADCNGEPCGFNPEYYQTYRLFAILNGQALGGQFLFSPLGGEAVLIPSQPLPEGTNSLVARATDSFGQQSAAVERRFTIDTVPPAVGALDPADGSLHAASQVTITGGVSESATIQLAGEGVKLNATGRHFSFPVILKPGQNTFTLSVTDAAGNQATQMLRYTLGAGIQLTVISPQSGSTASGTRVTVTGTVEGSPGIGVTVNGSVAALVGNRFLASLELEPGANTISVVATSQEGGVVSQTVDVTAGRESAVDLSIEPATGIAPHKASVTIPSLPGRTDARVDVDFDGDGVVDAMGFGIGSTVSYTYRTPGIYMAAIRLNDFEGGIHTATVPVVVRSVKELDTMLQKTIAAMRDRMQAGDIEGALQYFVPVARERYKEIFEGLGPTLADVASQLGAIVDGSIAEGFAEYVLVRDKPTGKQAYFIYLVPGDDGVWRISQM